jgi:Bacteriocin-protection, YdeI or OmpD-Associated
MLIWYVVCAKQEATREKRLKILIDASARGRRL